MTELFATFLAGLALFFHGVGGIKDHLQGLTSRRLRRQLARWSGHPALAGLGGFTFGAITQSSTAVAFILTGLVEGGVMTVVRALPIVAWANLGTVALVFFASFNLHLAFLYLLGAAGLALAFEVGGPRLRPVIGTLFCIGLLFFGLHLMKAAFAPLAEFTWFNELALFLQGSALAVFAAGMLLRLLVQSSSGIAVIALALTHGGLLTVTQAAMLTYGTGLGVALSIVLLSSHLRGTARRIALYQALINGGASLVLGTLFYVETLTRTPLLIAAAAHVTSDSGLRLAFAFFFLQSTAVTIALVFAAPAARWLERLAPSTNEQDLGRPHFVTDQALDDPESALGLVDQEQLRLLHFLPRQLDTVRTETAATAPVDATTLHRAGIAVAAEVQGFLRELVDRQSDHDTATRLFATERRHTLITALNESVHQFVTTLAQLRTAPDPISSQLDQLAESLSTLLLTAIEACGPHGAADLAFLQAMTADRGDLMERLRRTLLTDQASLGLQEKSQLSYLTSLFERTVWLLRQLGQTQSAAVPA